MQPASSNENPYAGVFAPAQVPLPQNQPMPLMQPPTYMPDWARPTTIQHFTNMPQPHATVSAESVPVPDDPVPIPEQETMEALGRRLRTRHGIVEHVYNESMPRPTAQLTPNEPANSALVHVPNFSMLQDFRRVRLDRQARRTEEHPTPPWENASIPPGLANVGAAPVQNINVASQEFHDFAAVMAQHQANNDEHVLATRRQRRLRAAQRQFQSFNNPAANDEDMPTESNQEQSARTDDHSLICAICQEVAVEGDMIATLECQHTFHLECVDAWTASTYQTGATHATCPQCRTNLVVVARTVFNGNARQFDISTPRSQTPNISETNFGTPQSTASAMPWWPSEVHGYYHTATQLPDGRLSFIVDPGAWTNLVGLKMARKMTQRALSAGHRPQQLPMERLNVQGVGSGSQQCNYKLQCPIGVPHNDGKSHIHKISTPIVEGSGADLPGLLGLRSLETDKAILDTGTRMLHFPGPGPVEIVLPPGSISVPLEKAPSGHLVMVVDDYERVVQKSGGTPETSLQLTAIPETSLNLVAAFSNKKAKCEDTCCSEAIPEDLPRGRCGMFCDICRNRPCMLRAEHEGSGPPDFGGCRCALAQRGGNCAEETPRRPMRWQAEAVDIPVPTTEPSTPTVPQHSFEM